MIAILFFIFQILLRNYGPKIPDGGQRIKDQIKKLTENINFLKMNPPG